MFKYSIDRVNQESLTRCLPMFEKWCRVVDDLNKRTSTNSPCAPFHQHC